MNKKRDRIPLSRKAVRLINAFEKTSNEAYYDRVEGGYDSKRDKMSQDKADEARKKLEAYLLDLEVRDTRVSAALV